MTDDDVGKDDCNCKDGGSDSVETSPEYVLYSKVAEVEGVIRHLFIESAHIETRPIRKGRSSSSIYVPKKFSGHAATVIIWKDVYGNKDNRCSDSSTNTSTSTNTDECTVTSNNNSD